MIRYTKHLGTNYIIVDSSLEVNGVKVPFRLQANIKDVEEIDHAKIYRVLSIAFDRHISFDKKSTQTKKPWWKVW
jgi:hypothetical protein